MRLDELFNEGAELGNDDMIGHLRDQVMDYLTPLAAKKVDYIPIQNVEDVLHQARTGLIIDRGLVMQLIDPNECKLVSKIEGDKVYLTLPVAELSKKTEDDQERDQDKIRNTASDMAKDAISS